MNITYTPAPCEGKEALFSGQVVLRVPAYEEILEVVTENPELMDDSPDKALGVKKLLQLVKWSYAFYEKVDITQAKTKKRYNKLDDLRHDMKCAAILQDVAIKLSSGLDLGND